MCKVWQKRFWLVLVLGWLCMALPAMAQEIAPDPLVTPETLLLPTTALYLYVQDEPDLSHTYEVDTRGEVHFQIGEEGSKYLEKWKLSLAGKTLEQAKNLIFDSLKRYLKEPQIRLTLTRYPRIRVSVQGAVRNASEQSLLPNARISVLFDQVDPKPEADLSKITILRRSNPDPKDPAKRATMRAIPYDFLALQRGESEEDFLLEAGDIVVIPATILAKPKAPPAFLHVYGEVITEATLPLAPNMTMKEVLARVGGLKPTARREKIRRIRGSDGKYFELNANRIEEEDPVHNQKVGAGDTIIVEARDQSLIFAISGEVQQPKTFPWKADEKWTVTRALEMAGGLTPKADRRKGVIRRGYLRNPTSATAIYFDLEEMAKGKQRDWEIEAGDDILILPKGARPNALKSLLPLLLRFIPLGL